MENTILFEMYEMIIDKYDEAMLAIRDDEDEIPPIVAAKCPDCHEMVEDFWDHRCNK